MSTPWAVQWVEGSITAIYEAKDTSAFDLAFSQTNFPTKAGAITVNGAQFSLNEYKDYLFKERQGETLQSFKFLEAVEVETGFKKTPDGSESSATVGLFYEAVYHGPTKWVRKVVTSSLNINVTREVGTFPPPAIGTFIKTGVASLNQVIIEKSILTK